MTASAERDSLSPRLDGRVFRLGSDWALCSFPLPTSMPIPLAVVAPGDIALATWAFTGMKARADRPTCLLLLRIHGAAAGAALGQGLRLVVATHFHAVTVATGPAEAAEGLPSGDRAVMARAVLSSVTPANVAALADPITLLAPALRSVPLPKDGPDFAVAGGRSGGCNVSGTDVPNYILFDGRAGYRCARVASARLVFSPSPGMDLDLESVWGPETGPSARTFLIGNRGFTVARPRGVDA